jgi:hypothetical protein
MVHLPPRVPRNSEKVPAINSEKTILVADRAQPFQTHGFPTVLVARDDDGLDGGPLVDFLQRNGFHVLEADSWTHVFDLVRTHSRPIHLLLANVSMDAHVPILKQHRSELQVLFVKKPVDADVVLANVRQLLGSPPSPSSIR